MNFDINYDICDQEQAFTLIKNKITSEFLLKNYKIKAKIEINEKDNTVQASGRAFNLFISFGSSAVSLDLKLGLLLKPVSSKIKKKIIAEIDGKI